MTDNFISCATKEISQVIVSKKEGIIKNAIDYKIGNNDWVISDLTGRGLITILPDKTEVFSFDGEDLLHFMHIETEIDDTIMGCSLKTTQGYYILY